VAADFRLTCAAFRPDQQAALSFRPRHSRGVGSFFRVSRSWLATHWFVAPASTSSSLDVGPCRLRQARFPGLFTDPKCSPLELDLSLGAPGHLPGSFASGPRRDLPLVNSSLEVSRPSSARGVVHLPSAALPQSLRSDLAVSHDLAGLLRSTPSRGLPGWHSWDSLPCRVTPASLSPPPSLAPTSPPDVVSVASAFTRALAEASAHHLDASPGSHSCESTVSVRFRFPFRGGPTPSWAFLFLGPRFRFVSTGKPALTPRPSGPVTFPN
jgi:hypothetical protein